VIDLYSWPTPNGRKVSIMLEETGIPYTVTAVDIGKGAQFAAEFLRISPNGKIPAIVDRETGIALMESGAILIYLAERAGCLLPDGPAKWAVLQWLMMQMGSVGPMLGQAHHFHHFHPGRSDYAEDRYLREAARIYGVLDRRLGASRYLGGEDFTIADIATWPWIARWEWHAIRWDAYPALLRWYVEIAARPAVRRGYDVPHATAPIALPH
jgi:GSH-dependent disulfide-bond oxidoreductase